MGEAKTKEKNHEDSYGYLVTGLTAEEAEAIAKNVLGNYKNNDRIKTNVLSYTSTSAKMGLFAKIDMRSPKKSKATEWIVIKDLPDAQSEVNANKISDKNTEDKV